MAEEVTAEAFLQAWATRERYCPELGTELSWLRGIAFNTLRHHYRGELRKQRAYLRAGAEVPSTEPGFDEDRLVEQVDAAQAWQHTLEGLRRMSTDEREVFVLFARYELTYQAIADQLKIPIGTVRSRLNRGRSRAVASIPSAWRGLSSGSDRCSTGNGSRAGTLPARPPQPS